MYRILKKTALSGLMTSFLICGPAEAAPQVRMQIQVKPVESEAQLYQLMLQNSLRIYQQRLRFFRQAEQQREQLEQARRMHRYRHRHRTRTMQSSVGAGPSETAAGSTASGKDKAALEQSRNQHRWTHRHREQTRTGQAEARPSKGALGLKKLLRRKRIEKSASLDKKLKSQLRKKARAAEQDRVQTRERRRVGSQGHGRGR